jgi:FkbM family methyltransferase
MSLESNSGAVSGDDAGARARTGATGDEFPARLKLLRWLGKQHWIPRGQDWVMRKVWHPDSGRSFPFEVDFFGARYPGNLASFIDWSVFAYGAYASEELSLLGALAAEIRRQRGHVFFFDVGANAGHHSLFMASRSDAVIAFEPFAPLQQLIQEKADLNGLRDLRIVPFALGAVDESRQYFPGNAANPGTGTFLPEEGESHQAPIPLEIRNGDAICEALQLPPIDILKVDVQGYEPLVFRGLQQRIRRDRPAILTEFSAASLHGYSSESEFRKSFWDGAIFAGVTGRSGRLAYKLVPFIYGRTEEVLILPPEMANFAGA